MPACRRPRPVPELLPHAADRPIARDRLRDREDDQALLADVERQQVVHRGVVGGTSRYAERRTARSAPVDRGQPAGPALEPRGRAARSASRRPRCGTSPCDPRRARRAGRSSPRRAGSSNGATSAARQPGAKPRLGVGEHDDLAAARGEDRGWAAVWPPRGRSSDADSRVALGASRRDDLRPSRRSTRPRRRSPRARTGPPGPGRWRSGRRAGRPRRGRRCRP